MRRSRQHRSVASILSGTVGLQKEGVVVAEPLTEEGVRRVWAEIFRAAADALSVESGPEITPEPPSAPQWPKVTLGERATLTVEEAAAILGISRGTAYEACRSGEIPSLRFGRRIVVPVHLLEQYLRGL